jgi:hypothetical protein
MNRYDIKTRDRPDREEIVVVAPNGTRANDPDLHLVAHHIMNACMATIRMLGIQHEIHIRVEQEDGQPIYTDYRDNY